MGITLGYNIVPHKLTGYDSTSTGWDTWTTLKVRTLSSLWSSPWATYIWAVSLCDLTICKSDLVLICGSIYAASPHCVAAGHIFPISNDIGIALGAVASLLLPFNNAVWPLWVIYWGLPGLSQGWKPKAGEWRATKNRRAVLADWTAALGDMHCRKCQLQVTCASHMHYIGMHKNSSTIVLDCYDL